LSAGRPPPSAPKRDGPRPGDTPSGSATASSASSSQADGRPRNVLTQAERCPWLAHSGFDFDGVRCPFLYATNGEVIWFHDVRHERNRSRQIKAFHTQGALKELLERDNEAALDTLRQMPHDHPLLRPYKLEANAAVEKALAERKRNLLVAMATGTGKTYTLVTRSTG
jgi:type I restriction enzyme R subunit